MISDIKKEARGIIKDKWKVVINVTFYYLVLSLIISWLASYGDNYLLIMLGSIIVLGLDLGFIYYVINFLDNKAKFTNIFQKFNILHKGIVLFLLKEASIIISGAFERIVDYVLALDINHINIIYPIITGIIVISTFIYSLNFVLSYFVLIENPNSSIKEIIYKSIDLMKGQKIKYLKLIFSFIGLFVLSIITLGLGFLWLIPYSNIALLIFYRKIKG